MGVGGAGGRLVELRERRAPRAVRSCACLAASRRRWRSGRLFGGRGIGGVAHEQDVAARPMQFGFECAIAQCDRQSPTLRRGWRRRGPDRPPRPRPPPAQSSRDRQKTRTFCSRASCRRRGACPRARASEPLRPSPTLRNTPKAPKHGGGHARRRGGRARRRSVAARSGSPRINSKWPRACARRRCVATWVRSAIRACIRVMSDAARSTSPRGHNTSARYAIAADAWVLSETKRQIVVTAGLEQGSARSK